MGFPVCQPRLIPERSGYPGYVMSLPNLAKIKHGAPQNLVGPSHVWN